MFAEHADSWELNKEGMWQRDFQAEEMSRQERIEHDREMVIIKAMLERERKEKAAEEERQAWENEMAEIQEELGRFGDQFVWKEDRRRMKGRR